MQVGERQQGRTAPVVGAGWSVRRSAPHDQLMVLGPGVRVLISAIGRTYAGGRPVTTTSMPLRASATSSARAMNMRPRSARRRRRRSRWAETACGAPARSVIEGPRDSARSGARPTPKPVAAGPRSPFDRRPGRGPSIGSAPRARRSTRRWPPRQDCPAHRSRAFRGHGGAGGQGRSSLRRARARASLSTTWTECCRPVAPCLLVGRPKKSSPY